MDNRSQLDISTIKMDALDQQQTDPKLSHDLRYDLLDQELQNFRENKILTDFVIIAGEEKFHAHKLLLAIYSSHIRNIVLSGNSVLDLTDVNPEVVSALLAFIYQGEVVIRPELLQDLLDVGNRLNVAGLAVSGIVTERKKKAPKRKRATSNNSTQDKKKAIAKGDVEVFAEKMEEEYFKSEDGKQFVCAYCLAGFGSKKGIEFHVLLHTDSAPLFQCFKCDYETHHKCHLKTHYMKHHSVEGTIFETIWKKQYLNQSSDKEEPSAGPSNSTPGPSGSTPGPSGSTPGPSGPTTGPSATTSNSTPGPSGSTAGASTSTPNTNKKSGQSSFAKRIKNEPKDVYPDLLGAPER